MILKNQEIYNYASLLAEVFNDENQKLPIKINFYLQKNKKTLINLARDIEKARLEIAQSNGILDKEGQQYAIPAEKVDLVQQELNDLFSLEQEVEIYTVDINTLSDDLMITTTQMEALMFMIN